MKLGEKADGVSSLGVQFLVVYGVNILAGVKFLKIRGEHEKS